MKKSLFVLLLAGLMIAACASATPSATLPAPAVNTQAPVVSQPTQAPAAAAQPTTALQSTATKVVKPISQEFTPTDPKSVKLAAGKPQFVEFFAFW